MWNDSLLTQREFIVKLPNSFAEIMGNKEKLFRNIAKCVYTFTENDLNNMSEYFGSFPPFTRYEKMTIVETNVVENHNAAETK